MKTSRLRIDLNVTLLYIEISHVGPKFFKPRFSSISALFHMRSQRACERLPPSIVLNGSRSTLEIALRASWRRIQRDLPHFTGFRPRPSKNRFEIAAYSGGSAKSFPIPPRTRDPKKCTLGGSQRFERKRLGPPVFGVFGFFGKLRC